MPTTMTRAKTERETANRRTTRKFRKLEDLKPYRRISDRAQILSASFGVILTEDQEKTIESALKGWCDLELRQGIERRLTEASSNSSMHSFMELAKIFGNKNIRKLICEFNKNVEKSDITTTKFSLIDILGDIAEGSELLTAGKLATEAAKVTVNFAHDTHLVQDFLRFLANLSKEGKIEFMRTMILEVGRINSDQESIREYLNSTYSCQEVTLLN